MKNIKIVNLDYFDDRDFNKIEEKKILKHHFHKFKNGEFKFIIDEDEEKCKEVYIYQRFNKKDFNNQLIKLYLCCCALKYNGIKVIEYVAPFIPYTRQDEINNKQMMSIGLQMIVLILDNFGIKKFTTYDLHSFKDNIQHNVKINNLSFIQYFLKEINQKFNLESTIIVLPDEGATIRFKKEILKKNNKIKVVSFKKKRTKYKIAISCVNRNYSFKDKNIVILDDIIDSGETIISVTKLLSSFGANDVYIYATHGILSGNCNKKIQNTDKIKEVTITNSVKNNNISKKIRIINIPLLT